MFCCWQINDFSGRVLLGVKYTTEKEINFQAIAAVVLYETHVPFILSCLPCITGERERVGVVSAVWQCG